MTYILQDYDNTLTELVSAERIPNRTGVDCFVKFGVTCRYDISEYFPVPTRRKYPFKSIIAELLWMLSGSTNVRDLEAMGSKIWTAWRNEEFEVKNGYNEGELGPIYGFQMRHAGGDYATKTGGFDQIQYLIDELKANKYSRRAVMNLWDGSVMSSSKVRLPCCHYSFTVNVDSQDRLVGHLVQRSGDWLPGISANITFYSALLYMLAAQLGFKPGTLYHSISNAHLYENQMEAAQKYLSSPIYDNPKLILSPRDSIFDYQLGDFKLTEYQSGEKLIIPVAV